MGITEIIALVSTLIGPIPANRLIVSDQNGTRPEKPYATITIRSVVPARPIESEVDEDGLIEFHQIQLNTVEVQFFGIDALNYAEMLGIRLHFETTGWLAEDLNIGISRVGRATRVPELLNASQYEERAILEFTAYDTLTATDNVGLIEHAEIECYDHVHTIDRPED